MSGKSKQDALLAAIQQKSPVREAAEAAPAVSQAAPAESDENSKRRTPALARPPKGRAGKPVQFWLHGEDSKILRELSAWVAGQGERTSDSLIIRSALRVAKTDSGFLKAYREAAQLDGRLKRHKDA